MSKGPQLFCDAIERRLKTTGVHERRRRRDDKQKLTFFASLLWARFCCFALPHQSSLTCALSVSAAVTAAKRCVTRGDVELPQQDFDGLSAGHDLARPVWWTIRFHKRDAQHGS